jgi:hypothetical protein
LIWVGQGEIKMRKPLKIAILEFEKMAAESQGLFALTKNLRIQLKIERNLEGGSTLVPLKINFYYSH